MQQIAFKLWSKACRSQHPTNYASPLLYISLFSSLFHFLPSWPPPPLILSPPSTFLPFFSSSSHTSSALPSPPSPLPLLTPTPPPPSPSPRYAKLHLHPLRSRVRDMEHKLKVAMDNLVRGVKVAASSRPPPGEGGREGGHKGGRQTLSNRFRKCI